MDYYNEYGNIKTGNNPSNKFYYLKKVTQILVSVSVFSILFSHSSLVDVLVESYDHLFSIKFFTLNSERNYIFLLCNGILVLIIRTSGLISKITPVEISSKGVRISDDLGEKAEEIGFQEKQKLELIGKAKVVEEKGRENGDYEEEVDGKEDSQEMEDEEEEEEEQGIDDELAKKCEDFIKKVKQEILGV